MPPTAVAAQDEEEEEKMASEPSLWLPLTVVRRHRKKATIIWVSLVIAFVAYISFIVWDTVDSRRDPASSFQLKQEVFSFPDVAICLTLYGGCLALNTADCLESSSFTMVGQYGFLNTTLEVDDASLEIEEAFPSCKVLPASKLQLNQTGIENGDVTYLTASFSLFWFEDPSSEYDPTDPDVQNINTQFVNLFFLDVDDGVEAIGKEIADARLPYERVLPTIGETFTTTTSHLVLALTEYEPISTTTGKKRETERTFTQSATTGKINWYWDTNSYESSVASLYFDLFIPRFEYTSIQEVDPVDAWAIIGAIGGVWQFVVIGFGLFFVYSEKQPPDKKMRNFRKTVVKPASIVTRRFSGASSRASTTSQDVVVDASGEDLPAEWVKKQRKDGSSFYYCNTMTGAVQDNSPKEGAADATMATSATRPRRGIARMFQPAHRDPTGTDDGPELEFSGVNLPPGWTKRTDGAGKTYYVNTVLKTTQWERPRQRDASAAGSNVQAVDAPMAHSRRGSGSSVQSPTSLGNNGHSGSGGNAGGVGGPAPPYRSTSTASSASAADGPPPSSVSKAPSYRTMVSLMPSSSEEAPGAQPSSAAATTFASTTGGGDAGPSFLPEGWHRRTTADGKTYYANTATKVTQWHAPNP